MSGPLGGTAAAGFRWGIPVRMLWEACRFNPHPLRGSSAVAGWREDGTVGGLGGPKERRPVASPDRQARVGSARAVTEARATPRL